jgi:hypothetical protein
MAGRAETGEGSHETIEILENAPLTPKLTVS